MAVSLQQFEIFLAVAEHEQFTAAAKSLGLSKAAVSQAIKGIEQQLQVPLFIRTTRRLSLTDEGRMLRAQCLRLHDELQTAREMISQFHQAPSGCLRISCSPYYASDKLLPVVKKYQQLYPQVKLDIIVEERLPDLYKENIDLVFGINWPAPDDIIARKIGQTRYVLCASPTYLQQHGTPTTVNDLAKHCYIPHSGRSQQNRLVNLKKTYQGPLHMPLSINHSELMKQAALNDMGIIQLHDYMVAKELADGSLIEVLADAGKPAMGLYLYYYKHRYVQPKIRCFVRLVCGD